MIDHDIPAGELERRRGVLAGLAAGDRNGGPTQMARLLWASLERRQRLDLDDLGASYLAWWRSGATDTGPVAAAVFTRVAAGMSYDDAALEVDRMLGGMTGGVNAAHRAAPLAMCAAIPDHELAAAAHAQARLTHLHPAAGDVAAAVVLLCRALIVGRKWCEAMDWTRERLGSDPWWFRPVIIPATKRDGFAPRVLANALRLVVSSHDFKSALDASVAFDGPANYRSVLVGAIAGARWGTPMETKRIR